MRGDRAVGRTRDGVGAHLRVRGDGLIAQDGDERGEGGECGRLIGRRVRQRAYVRLLLEPLPRGGHGHTFDVSARHARVGRCAGPRGDSRAREMLAASRARLLDRTGLQPIDQVVVVRRELVERHLAVVVRVCRFELLIDEFADHLASGRDVDTRG